MAMQKGMIICLIVMIFVSECVVAGNASQNNSDLAENVTYFNGSLSNYTNSDSNYSGNTSEDLTEKPYLTFFFLKYWAYITIAVFLVIFSIIYYILSRRKKEDKLPLNFIFSKNIGDMTADTFMKREYEVLSKNESLIEAVELFVEESFFMIPVLKDAKVIGILTKRGIFEKLKKLDYDYITKQNVNNYITKENIIYCKTKDTLEEILEIMKKNRSEWVIVLDDNDNFRGIIDVYDILKVFNRFLLKVKVKIENPPILSPIMSKRFPIIDSKSTIIKLKNLLIKKKSNFAIVNENGKYDRIVTLKDIMVAIYNGQDIRKTKINHISPIVFTMNPGSLIFDSIKVFLFKRYNQIPLKVGEKIMGIANLSDVNYDFYYNFIKIVE